jgi:hypothetical protein
MELDDLDEPGVLCGGPMPEFLRNKKLPDLPWGTPPETADLILFAAEHGERLGLRVEDVLNMSGPAVRKALAGAREAMGIRPLSTRRLHGD